MTRKRWDVELDGRPHAVELDHNYLTGRCRVNVDGHAVVDRRPSSLRDWFVLNVLPTEHRFEIDRRPCAVRIDPGVIAYAFDLIVEGRSLRTGRPATPPPWETPAPREVSTAAALIGAAMVATAVPLLVWWLQDPTAEVGALVAALSLLALGVGFFWGVRERSRQAWWGALLMGPGLLVGFVIGIAGASSRPADASPMSDAVAFAFLAWCVVVVVLFVASTVALVRPSVRREFAFASPPPFGGDPQPA